MKPTLSTHPSAVDGMPPVSRLRLNLLRVLYGIVVVGLACVVWPNLLLRMRPYELMEGVVACMLAAFSLLCALGLLQPLRMLPVLLWELFWKGLWLVAVFVPLWLAGRLDEQTIAVAVTVVPVLAFPFVMPWRYMVERYVRRPGRT
ncbi:MAG TPA: hypothetical protein VGE36_16350 [Roseateles sp.]